MNWIALGAVAEALAALAILVSFLFVKQQMKQNHEMAKASNQREILNALRDFFTRTRSDPEQFDAVARCLKEYEGADARSKHIFYMWAVDFMLIAEQAWYMRRDRYINEASYIGVENLWPFHPPYRRWPKNMAFSQRLVGRRCTSSYSSATTKCGRKFSKIL